MANDIDKMTKAEILKEFGPKIVRQFGKDELKFLKDESSGPGGLDRLRSFVKGIGYNKGGAVTKKSSGASDYRKGGMVLSTVDNRKRK